jgi:catechol 2,3-dioxygenase-like lactoylglutathione lyase family enzyme
VGKVGLDVEDQERAKAFWTTAMGFELVQDSASGGERRLEVRSPHTATILVLSRTAAGPGGRRRAVACPTGRRAPPIGSADGRHRAFGGRAWAASVVPMRTGTPARGVRLGRLCRQ